VNPDPLHQTVLVTAVPPQEEASVWSSSVTLPPTWPAVPRVTPTVTC
jgi:hypothetical protein